MNGQKAPLSTREWILLTTILALVQAGIWYVSFIDAKSASALNYVSFAGTLISIILAVLAIGYTYGESVAEKSKKDTVADQISELNNAIKNIVIESSKLDKISEINTELLKLSDNFTRGFGKTSSDVEEMRQSLQNFANNTLQMKSADAHHSAESFIQGLAKIKILTIKNAFIFLYFVSVRKISLANFIREMSELFRDIFSQQNMSSLSENVNYLYIGSMLSLAICLEPFGLLANDKGVFTFDPQIVGVIKNWLQEDLSKTKTDNSYIKLEIEMQMFVRSKIDLLRGNSD